MAVVVDVSGCLNWAAVGSVGCKVPSETVVARGSVDALA